MRILIVDDDPGTLNALKAGLSSFGHHVIVAQRGSEALEIIQDSDEEPGAVDLVITDLKMPGTNGLDLIRSVRKARPGLASVLMTAFGNDDVRKEAVALGTCGYIEKPFTPETLLRTIKSLEGQSKRGGDAQIK